MWSATFSSSQGEHARRVRKRNSAEFVVVYLGARREEDPPPLLDCIAIPDLDLCFANHPARVLDTLAPESLTYPYSEREFCLIDVAGNVVRDIFI